ncbi:MAG: DUF6580 family putative transport protein [Planctomycetaceae bacterium]
MKTLKSPQTLLILAACLLTIALRLIESPLPNFSSVVALSLFCGAILRHPAAILLPLVVRLATDVWLHRITGYGFFPSWPFDYTAYALICAAGFFVNPRKAIPVLGATLGAVVLYFVLSNLGVWVFGSDMYERSLTGFFQCYIKAIPFIRGTLYGNLLMASLSFAAWNMLAAPSTSNIAGDEIASDDMAAKTV